MNPDPKPQELPSTRIPIPCSTPMRSHPNQERFLPTQPSPATPLSLKMATGILTKSQLLLPSLLQENAQPAAKGT
eukprot:scaffold124038_cov24-Attheya_sp.AAC.1